MKTYLICESTIGYHSETNEDNCDIIPFVFIPTVSKSHTGLEVYVNCKNIQINDAIKEYINNKSVVFLLGYDLDENGELMAQALKNYMLSQGVKKEDIIRTPLTENGYVASLSFLDISEYITFRHHQDVFMKELRKKHNKRIGILDFLSIKYLVEKKGQKINFDKLENSLNLDKTSTITFVVSNLIKEI